MTGVVLLDVVLLVIEQTQGVQQLLAKRSDVLASGFDVLS